MENLKTNSLASHIQSLLDSEVDFPEKLKQHLVFKSDKVLHPFKFIGRLLSKGVLSDGSNESDLNFGLKEMMVQLAIMIVCSKGADGIRGLFEVFEESANSVLVSGLRAWVQEDFGFEIESDISEPKRDESAAQTSPLELTEQETNEKEMNLYGTKLIDKIMLRVEDEFMEKLEGHFISKASEVIRVPEFCSSLVHQKVLDEADVALATGPGLQKGQPIENVMKAVCSRKAIGSLVRALQSSNNEHILSDTYEWLETSTVRKKNYPIAVKSLANQRNKEESKAVRSTFFEQAALPNELSKLATFKYQQKSSTKGVSFVQFDKERMMACSTDGTLNLWNLLDGNQKSIPIAVHVKRITCFQYDEEIIVVGTAEGTVHLFDARSFEEKWSVRLDQPAISLKFVGSTVVVITRQALHWKFWWTDISRSDMRLLNQRLVTSHWPFVDCTPGVLMYPDISLVYFNEWVFVHDTKSWNRIRDESKKECCLSAPDYIHKLNVQDLICTKRVVVAGCTNGTIALWTTSKFLYNQSPVRTFQGGAEAIVSLCSLNGHLLGANKSGKLLMWSGHDLENTNVTPVPRLLEENSDVTFLAAHERWFASCSFKGDAINIWTLPDLWLRTG